MHSSKIPPLVVWQTNFPKSKTQKYDSFSGNANGILHDSDEVVNPPVTTIHLYE
jgi:hypothetical protein